MQINKLPARFRDLALQRRKEYGFPFAEETDVQSLWCAFEWKRTPEGAHFWDLVDDQKYNHATMVLNKRNRDEQKRQTSAL